MVAQGLAAGGKDGPHLPAIKAQEQLRLHSLPRVSGEIGSIMAGEPGAGPRTGVAKEFHPLAKMVNTAIDFTPLPPS